VPHVQATFQFLYPPLGPGAVYVVEDSQTSFMSATGGHPDGRDTIVSLTRAIALSMHKREGHVVAPDRPDVAALVAALGEITQAINFHRNLIVFERGDNGYPSNMAFTLEESRFQRIFAAIAREPETSPAPRALLSRIDMAIWGHDPQLAADLALKAAAANPGDAEVLTELVRMMAWAGRAEEAAAIGRRLRQAT